MEVTGYFEYFLLIRTQEWGVTALCYCNVKCSGALPRPIYPERAAEHNGDRSCPVHHLPESQTKEDIPAGMYTMMYRGAQSSET